jgi:hypothetical protein
MVAVVGIVDELVGYTVGTGIFVDVVVEFVDRLVPEALITGVVVLVDERFAEMPL